MARRAPKRTPSAARSALFRAAITIAPLAFGCGVEQRGPGTGGVDVEGGTAACPRGFAVVSSDYQSSNVSLIDPEGAVLSGSFISSASTSAGLSAPLSGDVVPSGQRSPRNELILIDRFPASVLSFVDLASAQVRAQLPLATSFVANPQDYAELGPTKAYVSRFESNARPGAEPFDSGNDVLVIDPSVPAIVASIDMMPAMAGEDPAYLPRAGKLVLAGSRLYALLSGYARDFRNSAVARLVAIDTATDTIEQVLVLEGMYGCAAIALAPGAGELAIACSGRFAGSSQPTLLDSGIVVVEIGERLAEKQRFSAASLGEDPLGFGLAYASAGTLVMASMGRFEASGLPARDDLLLELDLATGRSQVVLRSAGEPFTIGDVRCREACRVCFATDARRNAVHRFEISGGTLINPVAIEVDRAIGLPPRYLGEY